MGVFIGIVVIVVIVIIVAKIVSKNIEKQEKKNLEYYLKNGELPESTAECDKSYAIGDTGLGGGRVFYFRAEGFTMHGTGNKIYHYLEAAPDNMSTRLAWASSGYTMIGVDTSSHIGSGKENTYRILQMDRKAPAARACKEYSNNGKTDWFLPSIYELNELYKVRGNVDHMGSYSWTWSSSQYNNNFAWYQDFSNGNQNNNYGKNGKSVVRSP